MLGWLHIDWLDVTISIQLPYVTRIFGAGRMPIRSKQTQSNNNKNCASADQPWTDDWPKAPGHNRQHAHNEKRAGDSHYESRCFRLIWGNRAGYDFLIHTRHCTSNEKEISHGHR
jgi:hypothetical protein